MSVKIDLVEYWTNRIQRDLTPFADPGSEVELSRSGRLIRATWISKTDEHSATFSISVDTGAKVRYKERDLSYRSFLSSPEMADLRGLAKMILQTSKAKSDLFVTTFALEDGDNDREEKVPAVELLRDVINRANEADGQTLVAFVTGDAGAGKTSVLQALVKEQASNYTSGKTDCLYLYVNAQGRALARFNEALATELQDLRASVTYHAIAVLVRAGVLVPIIDGFDELLGVGGYNDAFASLAGFIEELDGEGCIVASSRSTYYESEFVARANTKSHLGSQSWRQIPIQVLAWGNEEFENYLLQFLEGPPISGCNKDQVVNDMRSLFAGTNAELAKKPLFVARALDLIKNGNQFTLDQDLLHQMVYAYLERERTEKILDRNGNPLLRRDQITKLLAMIAEEMWRLETRELDGKLLKEIASFSLELDGVDSSAQDDIAKRIASFALLSSGTRNGSVVFEHELFFSYFVGMVIGEAMRGSDHTTIIGLIGKSIVSPEIGYRASIFSLEEEANLSKRIAIVSRACSQSLPQSRVQLKENGGIIVSSLLAVAKDRGWALERLTLSNVDFVGYRWEELILPNCIIERCNFRKCDISRVKFVACTGSDISFREIVVDTNYTRLEFGVLDFENSVFGICDISSSAGGFTYDPTRVVDVLVRCGFVIRGEFSESEIKWMVDDDIVDIVGKLCRAYTRSNPICVDDDTLRRIFQNREWEAIREILVSHDLIASEIRATGGKPKEFLRRKFLPEQLLSGVNRNSPVPESVRLFWEELQRTFPRAA